MVIIKFLTFYTHVHHKHNVTHDDDDEYDYWLNFSKVAWKHGLKSLLIIKIFSHSGQKLLFSIFRGVVITVEVVSCFVKHFSSKPHIRVLPDQKERKTTSIIKILQQNFEIKMCWLIKAPLLFVTGLYSYIFIQIWRLFIAFFRSIIVVLVFYILGKATLNPSAKVLHTFLSWFCFFCIKFLCA